MSLFFSGAVTSTLDVSLLSPDSSYFCYSSDDNGAPCCCRRSPRLLTNGYYDVTEESFCRDHEGNVSLTPCKTNVSYKENLVRIFRRRRKPRNSLARLFSDVTETCQTWLDEKIFRGMFGPNHTETPPNPDKVSPPQTLLSQEIVFSEVRSSDQSFTQTLGGLSEVPPPPVYFPDACSCRSPPEGGGESCSLSLVNDNNNN
uniref:Transmembrane protein 71 n=1 Tax=Cynoglossus semilaevis TaxID=244447 RepID=A0A3P8VA67_CYNSE